MLYQKKNNAQTYSGIIHSQNEDCYYCSQYSRIEHQYQTSAKAKQFKQCTWRYHAINDLDVRQWWTLINQLIAWCDKRIYRTEASNYVGRRTELVQQARVACGSLEGEEI